MGERSQQGPALRVRLRSKLLGLEDKDVREQIDRELQKLYTNLHGSQEVDQGLKELFSNIDACNGVARKLRYRSQLSLGPNLYANLPLWAASHKSALLHRLCATLLQSHTFEDFANSISFLFKNLEQRGAVEDQAPAVTELAGGLPLFAPKLHAALLWHFTVQQLTAALCDGRKQPQD